MVCVTHASVNILSGRHGSLHPSNISNDTNGTYNVDKLEVWFDTDCVVSEDDAKAQYGALVSDFSECLYDIPNRKKNIYYVSKRSQYHAYFGLESSNCVDEIIIDYDDYCISYFEYEAVMSIESSSSSSSSSDYTCSQSKAFAPDGTWLWWLDRLDQNENNYFRRLAPEKTNLLDLYILDTGVLSSHDEFNSDSVKVIHLDDDWDDSKITHYHGTHVAGIAGGINVGFIRDFSNLVIYSYTQCRGLNDGQCYSQDIEDGWEAVLNQLAKRKQYNKRGVINMSWGGWWSQTRLDDVNAYFSEMSDYGAIMIGSAGNDGEDACGHGPSDCDNVISVGNYYWDDFSKTGDEEAWKSSNFGNCVDIYAPGRWIYSSVHECDSCYEWKSGTSMAAPVIAGMVATMIAYDNSLTREQILDILTDNSGTFNLDKCQNTNNKKCKGIKQSCGMMAFLIDKYSSSTSTSSNRISGTDTDTNTGEDGDDSAIESIGGRAESGNIDDTDDTGNSGLEWWVWLIVVGSIVCGVVAIFVVYFWCKNNRYKGVIINSKNSNNDLNNSLLEHNYQ